MIYNVIWTLSLQLHRNCTIISEIRIFFHIPQFLCFIPQHSIVRTQAVINTELFPCWKFQVSSIEISFNYFLTRIVCSQYFLLENFEMVLSFFLPYRWQASFLFLVILTPICCRILQTVDSSWSCWIKNDISLPLHILNGNTTKRFSSTEARLNWAALSRCHSFLWQQWFQTQWFQTVISNSDLKLQLFSLVSSVRVLLVCSWVFTKSLVSWVLLKGSNISQNCYRFEKYQINLYLFTSFQPKKCVRNLSLRT